MNTLTFKENTKFDIITLGRAGIDFNTTEVNVPMEENKTFIKAVGGSPANIAVATANLGLSVGFIGRVSDDAHGRYIRDYFVDHGINTDNLIVDDLGAPTGLAFTEVKSPTECQNIMYRNQVADLNLTMENISEDYIKDAKILLVSGTALAASPSREAVFLAIHYAKKHDTLVFFDIDYRGYTWNNPGETDMYCSLVAEKSDVIVGTREEFDVMETYSMPNNTDDIATAKRWMDHGAKIVFIKHGKEGSFAFTPDQDTVKGAVYPVQAVNTFGAGDSYAGGLIYGLLKNQSIYDATKLGAGAAAIVVQENACADAMPTLKQIEDFIANYNRGEK